MKTIHLLALVIISLLPWRYLSAAPAGASSNSPSKCLSCHLEVETEDGLAHQFERDTHRQHGLDCSDCHGGDRNLDDMDAVRKGAGYRGVPKHLDIPTFCARCHADANYMHEHNPSLPVDQLEKYQTSVHGHRLKEQKDVKVATCVSCHTSHAIGNAKTPFSSTYPANIPKTCGKCHSDSSYMAGYGIPTDQEKLFETSVHGNALMKKGDLGAPACNSCHGNHGAAPPGVASLDAVCGMCHAIEARLFDISAHSRAFKDQGLPLCVTCHSNHGIEKPSDSIIGLAAGQLCANCHNDDQSKASGEIKAISSQLNDLSSAISLASITLKDAGDKGMMTTDEEFSLKEADQTRVQARSSIHAAAVDSLIPLAKDGLAKSKSVKEKADGLIHEYHFRRFGLGISSIIITLLALALYLKIRKL